MDKSDRRRLVDAFAFALDAHAGQTRKGVAVPYASHLLQVAGLVLEAGGDAGEAAAALLHDAIEDCDVDAAELRERFGAEVASIVEACSDVLPGDASYSKSDWGERKTRYLARLARSAPPARRVAACDKLHNLRSLLSDLRAEGLATLERFNATPGQTRWYYEEAHRVLRDALPGPLRAEFDALIEALRGFVAHAEPPASG